MKLPLVTHKGRALIYFCVVCTLVFGFVPPQKVESAAVPVYFTGPQPVRVVGGRGSDAQVDTARDTNRILGLIEEFVKKELENDKQVYQLQQKALKEQTEATLGYINSGFDGDPLFIQNVELYRQQMSDDTAGHASDELADSNICGAFKYDVIKIIKEEYQAQNVRSIAEKTTCEMDEKTENNTEAFLNGDFESGGWGAWFTMISNPENTPLGSKLVNQERIEEEIKEKEDNALRESDWNNGFMSIKFCEDEGSTPTGTQTADSTDSAGPADAQNTASKSNVIRDRCVITMPGIIIQQQLAAQLQLQASNNITAEAQFLTETESAAQRALVNELFTSTDNKGLRPSGFTPPDLTYEPPPDDDENDTPGDMDGDTIDDNLDTELDGDNIPNNIDPDIDGDNIPNSTDPDKDGDGIPNNQDSTPNGPGGGTGDVVCDSNTFGIIFNIMRTGISVDLDFGLCDLSGFDISLINDLSSSQVTQLARNISFKDAILNTLKLLEYQLQIASLIDGAEETYTDKEAPFSNDSCWNLEFSESLTTTRENALASSSLSIATVLALEALEKEYNEGGSAQQVFDDFVALMTEGLVGNEFNIAEVEDYLFDEVIPAVDEFIDDVTDEENACS